MYVPAPIDTSDVDLSPEVLDLAELLAKNTHDVWAKGRLDEGWSYGPARNDELKQTPLLVPYEELSESEKEYDRNTSLQSLKAIVKLGFEIRRPC